MQRNGDRPSDGIIRVIDDTAWQVWKLDHSAVQLKMHADDSLHPDISSIVSPLFSSIIHHSMHVIVQRCVVLRGNNIKQPLYRGNHSYDQNIF